MRLLVLAGITVLICSCRTTGQTDLSNEDLGIAFLDTCEFEVVNTALASSVAKHRNMNHKPQLDVVDPEDSAKSLLSRKSLASAEQPGKRQFTVFVKMTDGDGDTKALYGFKIASLQQTKASCDLEKRLDGKVVVSEIAAAQLNVAAFPPPVNLGELLVQPCKVAAINWAIQQAYESPENQKTKIPVIRPESQAFAHDEDAGTDAYQVRISFTDGAATSVFQGVLEGANDKADCKNLALIDWNVLEPQN